MKYTRRDLVKLGATAGAYLALGPKSARGFPSQEAVVTKPIPFSGEEIPIIGIGTRSYNTGASAEVMEQFRGTLKTFVDMGGTVIDTAAGYGRSTSETVLGNLIAEQGTGDDVFWATKVDREGRAEGVARMEGSFEKLHQEQVDLMQVHNLRDTSTQLGTMREWQQDGRIRYIGVTSSSARAYDAMVATIQAEPMDFVQINYSIADRSSEHILRMCGEKGIATMINLPYGRGRTFERVGDTALPDWAAEFCGSWGNFFLKYVVSHPAITVAIPGTTKPHHAEDNMNAARGWMPDAAMRTRMEAFFDAL
ncbi:MAG: aldo/keto reductase [Gemmatimonadota bacterium]|nr:aldo/keto reductase [Gemmatimonadota bacterium]